MTSVPGIPTETPKALDVGALNSLLADQSGVVSRAQLVGLGAASHDLERLLRRRDLTVVHPGVYVDHTGAPSWVQRAWAAVLVCWPAALAGDSALRADAGQGWRGHDDEGPIEVAVERGRSLVARPGIRVRRLAGFEDRVRWSASPPRERVEEAVIDRVLAIDGEWERIERLAQPCRARMTTPERLARALAARRRVRGRKWIAAVLDDIATGASSVLEQGYLDRVERAHGLPPADRQCPESTAQGTVYRDVHYHAFGFDVELDGRLWHDTTEQRDRDLDRDLDAAAELRRTVRLGWGQVFGRPCRTAATLGRLLQRLGWDGAPVSCGPDCPIGQ